MLAFIWNFSITLGIASLGIMLTLVLARMAREFRSGSRETQRKRLMSSFIRYTETHDHAALRDEIRRVPPDLAIDVGFEFLELVRGEDRRNIENQFAAIGLDHHIRRRLRHGDEATRIHAAELLVPFPDTWTIDALLQALRDRSREVRIAASISLSRIDALPPLLDVLDRIGPRGLRSQRLVELFESLPANRENELISLIGRGDVSSFVTAAAIDALSAGGEYRHLELFADMSRDARPEVAAAAIRALGHIAHPGAADQVLPALEHHAWEVRTEAAEAVGRIGLGDAAARLGELLGDTEWTVRLTAGHALQALGDPGRTVLADIAAGGSARAQRTATLLLAEGEC